MPAIDQEKYATQMSDLKRWAFTGAFIGLMLSSPAIWYFASLFDHSLRSLWTLPLKLLLVYPIGIPPSFLTGYFYLFLKRKNTEVWLRRTATIMLGAFLSTYIQWFFIAQRLYDNQFDWDWLSAAGFMMFIGAASASAMLFISERQSRELSDPSVNTSNK